MKKIAFLLFALCFAFISTAQNKQVIVGAERTKIYLPLLKNKTVALFSNQTGVVGNKHTVDLLVEKGVNVVALFSPEHGFRGDADAGEQVNNSIDSKTGIPIFSLYQQSSSKPGKELMAKFDVLIVDIQDVGTRFYTYYITMLHLMEACAENGKQVVIFDRPNPNGFYVDGPVLDMKYKSGVGALPIPVVHGMTLGELALMINGEHWLPDSLQCNVKIITCENYTHQTKYQLPVPPSPNLPDMKSVYLYPSMCYFEATPISLGRGTDKPFQMYGHPNMIGYNYSFTPHSRPGAKEPLQMDKVCYGVDLENITDSIIWKNKINLSYLIDAYTNMNLGKFFFTNSFERLIGVDYVQKMILEGKSSEEIKAMWKNDVEKFKRERKPYLLYAE